MKKNDVEKKVKKNGDAVVAAVESPKKNQDAKEKKTCANESCFPEQIRNDFYNFFIEENPQLHSKSIEIMNSIRKGKYEEEIAAFESKQQQQN